MATTTLEQLVADAGSEVAQLRAEPGLDPARIGVVGHSEGGMVATMVLVAVLITDTLFEAWFAT